MTGLKRDLLFAIRMYRRTPMFTLVAVAMLAVAIGVATAAFSHYSRLTLQSVAGVEGSDRIVSVGFARDRGDWLPLSLAQFEQFKAMTSAEALFALGFPRVMSATLADGTAVELGLEGVNRGFFRDAGVPMLMGADLAGASADPLALHVVITERFWREHLGASPGAVGSTITFGDHDFRIVGIAGGGFEGLRGDPRRISAWVPLRGQVARRGVPPMLPEHMRAGFIDTAPGLNLLARLRAGVTLEDAQRELDAMTPRLRDEWRSLVPPSLAHASAMPGRTLNPWIHQAELRVVRLLLAGAMLILVIAALNLASYFLMRGATRIHEFRTRLSVGASRVSIVRQLFVEGALLVAAGALLGGIVQLWLRVALHAVPEWARADDTDWRVVGFALGAATLVAVLSALVPAARIALRPRLTATAQSAIARQGGRWQPLLVAQVSIATLVVVAGLLFAGELLRLQNADVGFEPDGLMAAPLYLNFKGGAVMQGPSPDLAAMTATFDARVGAVPGIDSYAFASHVPFAGHDLNAEVVELVGAPDAPEAQRRAYPNVVSARFFETLRIPMLAGRSFDPDVPREAVVSAAFARTFWGRTDVLGEQFSPVRFGGITVSRDQPDVGKAAPPPPREIHTIVGVAGDVRYSKTETAPAVYYTLSPWAFRGSFVARGSAPADVVHTVVDEVIRERLPPHYLAPLRSMRERMQRTLGGERARSLRALGASLIALVLTMVGLYSSLQHMVESRRSEFAIRKALGATAAATGTLILGRAAMIVLAGVLLAVAIALAFGEQVAPYLFGLDLTDLRAWGVALLVVAVTGFGAAWLPARRASVVDPAVALRYE